MEWSDSPAKETKAAFCVIGRSEDWGGVGGGSHAVTKEHHFISGDFPGCEPNTQVVFVGWFVFCTGLY